MLAHLEPSSALSIVLLIISLLLILAFEATNRFHDAANAVATVIYTNSLPIWARNCIRPHPTIMHVAGLGIYLPLLGQQPSHSCRRTQYGLPSLSGALCLGPPARSSTGNADFRFGEISLSSA